MQTTKKIRPDRWLALGFALLMLSAVGCVEQRFVIITEPDGAIAWDYRNRPLSATPADMPFTYYGKYLFTLSKEGYETKVVEEQVRAPWYMLPGLDFVSENVLPWTIRDVRTFHYTLTPLQTMSLEDILFGASALRTRAEGIGQPRQAPSPPPDVASMPPPFPPPGSPPLPQPAQAPFDVQPSH